MFFYVAKIAGFLLQPSAILVLSTILALIALLAGRRRIAIALVAIAALICAAAISPLPNILALPLEQRYPRTALDGPPIRGVVILGGGEDAYVAAARSTHALTDGGERISEAVALAVRLPEAKIVFSGGSADLQVGAPTEASAVHAMLTSMGVDRQRLVLEDKSRDTYENAVLTREIVKPKPGERWLLVTSAMHMPRAMAIFRNVGFAVEPWPVDYRTAGWQDAARPFYVPADGLRRLDLVTREYIGLVAYWASGRTDTLW